METCLAKKRDQAQSSLLDSGSGPADRPGTTKEYYPRRSSGAARISDQNTLYFEFGA